VGKTILSELYVSYVLAYCTCVMSGRGIIRTADEGPTTEAMNNSTVDEIERMLLRHIPKRGELMAETKSRDHR
jgi:hypothetical protein